MHLHGEGVTRNFLTILEADVRRTAKSLLQVGIVAGFLLLLAWVGGEARLSVFLFVPVAFVGGFLLSAVHARFFVLESYEVSLRDHWNRWMRWSVSCKTVRECYAKVHDLKSGPTWWVAGLILALLLVAHAVLLVLSLNEGWTSMKLIVLYTLDACLLGLFAGRRLVERRWYRRFLAGCNQLLQDGTLGLWGVY